MLIKKTFNYLIVIQTKDKLTKQKEWHQLSICSIVNKIFRICKIFKFDPADFTRFQLLILKEFLFCVKIES